MNKEDIHRTSERSGPHSNVRNDRKHAPKKGGDGGTGKKQGAGGHNWVG